MSSLNTNRRRARTKAQQVYQTYYRITTTAGQEE